MQRRIGIYSGTFDPVHAGHLAFAQAAQQACALDEVVFLPERLPREKHDVTSITRRMKLLEEAVAPLDGLRVELLNDHQFTVQQTLPQLQRLFAGAELTLLVGSDVVHTFRHRWEGLDTLLASVSLAIGMRAGDSEVEIGAILRELAKEYDMQVKHTFIYTPHAAVTSSQIRNI